MNEHAWLEQVLAQMARGVPRQEALAQVPEAYRAAVAEALEAARWFQTTAAPALQRRAQGWNPPPAPRPQPVPRPGWRAWLRPWPLTPRLAWALAALVVALTLTWTTAYAAPQALPGQWAYPIKRAWETARWAVASPEARVRLALELAATRLDEAQRAWEQGLQDATRQALRLYQQHLADGLRVWHTLPPSAQQRLRALVEEQLAAQQARLQAWQVPLDLQPLRAQQRAFARAAAATGWPRPTPAPGLRATASATAARATASPSPTATSAPATATPTATQAPTPTPAPTDDTCVSRGRGRGQNQCVPPDQGGGNDNPLPASPPPEPAPPPDAGPPSNPDPPSKGGRGRP